MQWAKKPTHATVPLKLFTTKLLYYFLVEELHVTKGKSRVQLSLGSYSWTSLTRWFGLVRLQSLVARRAHSSQWSLIRSRKTHEEFNWLCPLYKLFLLIFWWYWSGIGIEWYLFGLLKHWNWLKQVLFSWELVNRHIRKTSSSQYSETARQVLCHWNS